MSNASTCVEKYVKEIEIIRKRYNIQLDTYIKQLQDLKQERPADPVKIKDVYKIIREVIKNEALDEKNTDSKIKSCVCNNQTAGKLRKRK